MEKKKSNLLLSKPDAKYFNKNQNKFELAVCPYEGVDCKETIDFINEKFDISYWCRLNKDFNNSIEALKGAYVISTELKHSTCAKCAVVFRATITRSLENIHDELHKMSTGILRTNRYQKSYEMAGSLLKKFENEGLMSA